MGAPVKFVRAAGNALFDARTQWVIRLRTIVPPIRHYSNTSAFGLIGFRNVPRKLRIAFLSATDSAA